MSLRLLPGVGDTDVPGNALGTLPALADKPVGTCAVVPEDTERTLVALGCAVHRRSVDVATAVWAGAVTRIRDAGLPRGALLLSGRFADEAR